MNIRIKHDFPFINIRKVPMAGLKTEGEAVYKMFDSGRGQVLMISLVDLKA